jgi:hypothetical protein
MRQCQPLGLQLDVAEQEQVDVDRPGTVPGAAEGPPVLGLDRLRQVEQLLGLQGGPDPDCGVEEVGLVQDLADRFRLVERRDGLDRDAVCAQVLDGAAQVRLPVADVRAEPEKAEPRLRAQTPSSSSGSRSRARSRVTSTPASCTG